MTRLLPFVLCLGLAAGCGSSSDDAGEKTGTSSEVKERYEPTEPGLPEVKHRTKLVLLGTGTPYPEPDSAGPCSAVIVDDRAYLIDAGAGAVRRAAAAFREGVTALEPTRLRTVLFTHLHSDHTLGYPDLLFTPWVIGRREPLEAYGPPGLKQMTDRILSAWEDDLRVRTADKPGETGPPVSVTEISPGPVPLGSNVKITAFPVKHGIWEHAYGYRFEGPDRTIVISGDTVPTEATIEACDGCDILLHEVYALDRFRDAPASWRRYHETSHTSTKELAELAKKARPKLLVLYHQLTWGGEPDTILDEIKADYDGEVIYGRDLDVL